MACFICGASDEDVKMFDVISESGLVKVCERCASEVDLPIIRKSEENKKKEIVDSAGESFSVKKMKEYAGMNSTENKNVKEIVKEAQRDKMSRARRVAGVSAKTNYSSISYRDLVERKLEGSDLRRSSRQDLVDNFHWKISRARRARRITSSQLAREVGESDMTIKNAENGIIAEGDRELVGKLENYLRISLIRDEYRNKNQKGGIAGNDGVTISDLNNIKEKVEGEYKIPYWRRAMNKFFSKKDTDADVYEEVNEEQNYSDVEFSGESELIFDESGKRNVAEVRDERQVAIERVDEEANRGDISRDKLKQREVASADFKDDSEEVIDLSNEETTDIKKIAKKRDLTPEEINALIFGAKKK